MSRLSMLGVYLTDTPSSSPQECKALAWWDEVKDAVFGEDFN